MTIITSKCPQCNSEHIEIDYGPEFNLLESDKVIIGFLCPSCLHVWAKNYQLVPVEDE